jgi:hypothetical protein
MLVIDDDVEDWKDVGLEELEVEEEEVEAEDWNIPDDVVVNSMKKLREQKRGWVVDEARKGKESRLIRDDEEDDDEAFEDYRGDRIKFGEKSKIQEAREKRLEIIGLIGGEMDAEDPEEMDWEMDVIRHATGMKEVGKVKRELPSTNLPMPSFGAIHVKLEALENALKVDFNLKVEEELGKRQELEYFTEKSREWQARIDQLLL